jgi:hypothetical protein
MSRSSSFKKLWSEQPLLAGCGCVLLVSVVLCGSGGLLMGLGWEFAGGKISKMSGVDSIFETSKSLAERGLTFGVSNTTEAGTEYTLLPMQPREVTCEELKAALGPHLTGDLATIVILSESTMSSQSHGVPIRCTWDAKAASVPSAVEPVSIPVDGRLPDSGP